MGVKRGIYLVANKRSEDLCENLIYSIRQMGCSLPIKVIHFGGIPVEAPYILQQATMVKPDEFSPEAVAFINEMQVEINNCPRGFLYRFLPWFGEWDEFIYTDNDICGHL
jgi:hypothetical protein